MAPKNKFTKEEMVAAALQVVRTKGIDGLTAKTMADALGTSTQPIFTAFGSMDTVRQEVCAAAVRVYDRYTNAGLQEKIPFFGVGMQYIRFATIRHAYDLAAADPDFHPTDDTRVVVDYLPDEPVAIVSGAETNLKITTLEDIPTAERIAEEILGRDPKEEARARMHALLAQAAGQMHR